MNNSNQQYIYLHGFASSPASAKAKYFKARFADAGINLIIPDLNQDDFAGLTLTRQLQQIETELTANHSLNTEVTVIGSSLGGLTAAWLAQRNPQVKKIVLLAPAFGFFPRWLDKLGEEKLKQWEKEEFLQVYHYGEKQNLPLNYDFVRDVGNYQDEELQRQIPTLIVHGIQDEVIPVQQSRDFVASRPWVKLIELDSDHSLGNVVGQMWRLMREFCDLGG